MLPTHGIRILVVPQPVDFRKGHDGLAALVQMVLKEDPFTGTVFVFRDAPIARHRFERDGACGRTGRRSCSETMSHVAPLPGQL